MQAIGNRVLRCPYYPIKCCEAANDDLSIGSSHTGAKPGKEVTPYGEGGLSSSNRSGIFNTSLHADLFKGGYVRGVARSFDGNATDTSGVPAISCGACLMTWMSQRGTGSDETSNSCAICLGIQ